MCFTSSTQFSSIHLENGTDRFRIRVKLSSGGHFRSFIATAYYTQRLFAYRRTTLTWPLTTHPHDLLHWTLDWILFLNPITNTRKTTISLFEYGPQSSESHCLCHSISIAAWVPSLPYPRAVLPVPLRRFHCPCAPSNGDLSLMTMANVDGDGFWAVKWNRYRIVVLIVFWRRPSVYKNRIMSIKVLGSEEKEEKEEETLQGFGCRTRQLLLTVMWLLNHTHSVQEHLVTQYQLYHPVSAVQCGQL